MLCVNSNLSWRRTLVIRFKHGDPGRTKPTDKHYRHSTTGSGTAEFYDAIERGQQRHFRLCRPLHGSRADHPYRNQLVVSCLGKWIDCWCYLCVQCDGNQLLRRWKRFDFRDGIGTPNRSVFHIDVVA